MTVRFLVPAEAEVDEAVAYYNMQRDGFGRDFARAIYVGLERISEFPNAWSPFGDHLRRYRLERFPYGILYTVVAPDIVVVAVMHLHRKPDYWRDRLTLLS